MQCQLAFVHFVADLMHFARTYPRLWKKPNISCWTRAYQGPNDAKTVAHNLCCSCTYNTRGLATSYWTKNCKRYNLLANLYTTKTKVTTFDSKRLKQC